MRLLILLFTAGLSSCSLGPLEITHSYGSMPKGRMNLPGGVKLHASGTQDDYETRLEYKRDFQ